MLNAVAPMSALAGKLSVSQACGVTVVVALLNRVDAGFDGSAVPVQQSVSVMVLVVMLPLLQKTKSCFLLGSKRDKVKLHGVFGTPVLLPIGNAQPPLAGPIQPILTPPS